MSDKEKTTPKIFKFGDNQYTVTDYNTAYDQNVQDFIEFARQRGQFDDTSIKLLQESLQNRRADINNNIELNHLGGTNTDTPNNISIPTYERKGLRKKEKYVDQDITEWVNYFNRSIIDKMNKYTPEPEKNPKAWDINKYGLLTAFNSRPAESYFNNYDKATGDGTTPRTFNQRNAELLAGLQRYKTILKDHNFDYTKNDDWRDDDYGNILTELENELKLDTPNQQNIARLLRQLRFTEDYVTAFTSDQHKWNEPLTQTAATYKAAQDAKAEQQIEEQVKKEQEALNAKNKQIRDVIQQQWTTRMSQYYLPHEFSNMSTFPILTSDDYNSWLNDKYIPNVHKGNTKAAVANLATIYEDINKNMLKSNYWENFNKYWFYHKMNSDNPLNTINHEGVTYYTFPMPDTSYHYTVGFDPNTGKFIKYYYLNGTDLERQQVFKKWLEKNIKALSQNVNFSETDIKNAFLDYFPHTNITSGIFKDGGILFAQQGSELNAINNYINKQKQETNAEYQRQADEAGISLEALKSKKRRIFGDETFYDDNAGLEGEDIARLVAASANLASIFLDPVSGFVTGLGSSLVDFGADVMSDDVSFGQSLKGLVGNVGMDLLGIIPGWGDSVGTMGKIKKTFVRYAPRIIGYLSTASSLYNTPQIIESFKKLIDDPNNINRDDLKNMVEGINLLATTSQTGRHHVANARAKQAATTGSNKIQLQVKNTSTGKNETIVVEGNAAKEISKNVSNPDKINTILRNHQGFSNYEVRTDIGRPSLRWVKSKKTNDSDSEWQRPIYWKQNAQVEHFDADKFKKKYKEYYFGSNNAKLLIEPGSTLFSHAPKPRVINDKTNTKSKAETKAIKKYKENLNKQLQELDKLHNDVKDYNNKHTTLENQLNDNNLNIQTTQQSIDDLSKEIVNLEYLTRGKSKMSDVDYDNVKKTLEGLRSNQKEWLELKNTTLDYRDQRSIKTELEKIENEIQENIQKLTDIDNFKKLSQKRQQLDELNQQKENLNQQSKNLETARENLENAKKTFEELLSKTRENSNRNSRTYKFDGKTYNFAQPFSIDFDKYKFQQGGKIDMEKINKFLKYAKG